MTQDRGERGRKRQNPARNQNDLRERQVNRDARLMAPHLNYVGEKQKDMRENSIYLHGVFFFVLFHFSFSINMILESKLYILTLSFIIKHIFDFYPILFSYIILPNDFFQLMKGNSICLA